jgi:hypothetical protein
MAYRHTHPTKGHYRYNRLTVQSLEREVQETLLPLPKADSYNYDPAEILIKSV